MKNKLWILIFSAFLMSCTSSFSTVNQVEDRAFLQLEGHFNGTQLIIDETAPINISEESVKSFELNGRLVVRFPLTKGTHSIKVLRGESVVVNRKIYVTNANTFEVIVP